MINYFWKIRVKLGDKVKTNDGFSGKITAICKNVFIVKYSNSPKTLKVFNRKSKGEYLFESLTLDLSAQNS